MTVEFNGSACVIKGDGFSAPLREIKKPGFYPSAEAVAIPLANSKSYYTLMFPTCEIVAKKEAIVSYGSGSVMRGQNSGLVFLLYDDDLDGHFGADRSAIGVTEADSTVLVFPPPAAHFATSKAIIDLAPDVAADGKLLTYEKHQGRRPACKCRMSRTPWNCTPPSYPRMPTPPLWPRPIRECRQVFAAAGQLSACVWRGLCPGAAKICGYHRAR